MALLAGIYAIQQSADEADYHVFGYQTARTTANTILLDVWNASTSAGRKFTIDLNGKIYSAAWTAGDVPYISAGSITGVKRMDTLAIGTVGKILRSTGTAPAWTTATIPDTTTRGAVLVASAANVWAALAVGTVGKFLRSDGTDLLYSTATIPDTVAAGDLLYGSATNIWTALAKGTTRQVLQMNAGATLPEWTSALSISTLAVTSGLTLTGAIVTGLTAASVGAGTFPSGAFVFAGALSGITTLGTTGTVTIYKANASGAFQLIAATGTNASYMQIENTGGVAYVGLDNYDGSAMGSGVAYTLHVRSPASLWLGVLNSAGAVKVAATTGIVTVASLAGTGSRTVVADANGVLSAP